MGYAPSRLFVITFVPSISVLADERHFPCGRGMRLSLEPGSGMC